MRIYSDGAQFTVGKANVLEEGCDVAIVACGIMVLEALRAREMLLKKGISAAVLDVHTVKPIDEEALVKAAQNCGAVVTAENHNAVGGLGSAAAEVLSGKCPVPLECVAVFESFGEVGTQDYLQERFHLTARDIAEKAERCIRRKYENCSHQ